MKITPIHNDSRGSIDSITESLNGIPEIAVLKTNAGYARGGCIHPVNEYICVLKGRITFRYRSEGLKIVIQEKVLYEGHSMIIPANVPHYYVSDIDSVVIEWGVEPKDKQLKHEEFRAIVEEHNKNI